MFPHWTRSGGQAARQVNVGSQTEPGAQQETLPVSSWQHVQPSGHVIRLKPFVPAQQKRPTATQAQLPASQYWVASLQQN
jgi:hypothetical protein